MKANAHDREGLECGHKERLGMDMDFETSEEHVKMADVEMEAIEV